MILSQIITKLWQFKRKAIDWGMSEMYSIYLKEYLNLTQILTSRQPTIRISSASNFKIGTNILSLRLSSIYNLKDFLVGFKGTKN
jgi:hypothetical protein